MMLTYVCRTEDTTAGEKRGQMECKIVEGGKARGGGERRYDDRSK
jgi:hypothetical protein